MKQLFLILLLPIQSFAAEVLLHPTCAIDYRSTVHVYNDGKESQISILQEPQVREIFRKKNYQIVDVSKYSQEQKKELQEWVVIYAYSVEAFSLKNFFSLPKITATHDFFSIPRYQTGNVSFLMEFEEASQSGLDSSVHTSAVVDGQRTGRVEILKTKYKKNSTALRANYLEDFEENLPVCVLE